MVLPAILWGIGSVVALAGGAVYSIFNKKANTELATAQTNLATAYTKLPEETRTALTSSKTDDFLVIAKKSLPIIAVVGGVILLSILLFKR